MSLKVLLDISNQIVNNIKTIKTKSLKIGIPASDDSRTNDPSIGNAYLGFINEKGSPANNIPARPFLVPGVEDGKKYYLPVLENAMKNSLTNPKSLNNGLEKTGLIAVSKVKRRIVQQRDFAPLSDKTIKERKSKGFEGEKALIRTGQLLNSITYVIEEK